MDKLTKNIEADWWTQISTRKISLLGVMFVLSMGVALNPIVFRFYNMPYFLQVSVTFFWIGYALLLLAKRGFGERRLRKLDGELYGKFRSLVASFALPKVLIYSYGLLLFVIGVGNPEYASTGYTQIASILLPLAALYIFRDKAVDYIYYACSISFVLIALLTCIVFGPGSLVAPILSIVEPETVNPFENHQFTFTTAYLFIYYLCMDKRKGKRNVIPVITTGLMTIMGFKRILVLSLIAVICVYWTLERFKERGKRRACRLIGWLTVFACVGFVYLVYSGQFFSLMDTLGIQTMGRIYYYQIVVDHTSFSPTFLGLGLNAVSKMLTLDYSYLGVGGVHSDVLKYYAEIGFVGFFLWLWAYLYKIPRYIEFNFGVEASCAMCLINVLTFTSFLTDNIDIYLGSQFLYIAIPITIAMRSISKDTQKEMTTHE